MRSSLTFLGVLLVVGCSFKGSSAGGGTDVDGGPEDADASIPPATPEVHFVDVTATVTELEAGEYGFRVTAVLQNDLDVEITGVRASLSFDQDTTDRRDDFRWRDLDQREAVTDLQPQTVAADGGQATFEFVVDALPTLAPPGPIEINGFATFDVGGSSMSSTPLELPLSLPLVESNPAIVVNTAADQNGVGVEMSFREALILARNQAGVDRIVFDPGVFPAGQTTAMVLDENNGQLPILDGTGGNVIIDGSGAGFALAADSNWESPGGTYGLRVNGGRAVVSGITFLDMGYHHVNEGDLSGNNCGGGSQLEGGSIRANGGTLILEGNHFADTNVAERNCFAAAVRLTGGSGHHIRGNTFTDPSMDALFIDAATVEVSDNVMDVGSDQTKSDECIYVNSQGGEDLWIIGNLCLDMEYSAVVGRGGANGTLYVVNNTFARNGQQSLSAVRREQNARVMVLRNNAYLSNNPAAVQADNNGTDFDLAYEATEDNPLCSTCGGATIDMASIIGPTDLDVVNDGGSTLADFTPDTGSALIDSGLDILDRNGKTPGRFNGTGPERGAVELP